MTTTQQIDFSSSLSQISTHHSNEDLATTFNYRHVHSVIYNGDDRGAPAGGISQAVRSHLQDDLIGACHEQGGQ